MKLAHASPSITALGRCAIALPLLGALAWAERRRGAPPLPARSRWLARLAGLFLAGDLIVWSHAIDAIGAGLSTHEVRPDSIRPQAQLLDGACPEGVRGSKDHLAARGCKPSPQLRSRGGLTGAIDADHEVHDWVRRRPGPNQLARSPLHAVQQHRAQPPDRVLGVLHLQSLGLQAQVGGQTQADFGAQVGADQGVLEELPERVVDWS